MDDNFVGQMAESFVKYLVIFVIVSSVITGVVVHSITKSVNNPEQIQYKEAVKSLTPEQRKILGL